VASQLSDYATHVEAGSNASRKRRRNGTKKAAP
jgi:hypothetical protein